MMPPAMAYSTTRRWVGGESSVQNVCLRNVFCALGGAKRRAHVVPDTVRSFGLGYVGEDLRAFTRMAIHAAAPASAMSAGGLRRSAGHGAPKIPRVVPNDRIDQRDVDERVEPTEANEPTEKADAADPMDASETAEPTEPIDSTEFLEAMHKNDSSDHSDHRLVPEARARLTPVNAYLPLQSRQCIPTATICS
jgi:hypothetical protein